MLWTGLTTTVIPLPIVRSLLVTTETETMADVTYSNEAMGYSTRSIFPRSIGRDASPVLLAKLDTGELVPTVVEKLATTSRNIDWPSNTLSHSFMSSMPEGANTNFSRSHAMTLNSSVSCSDTPLGAEFPSQCSRSPSFSVAYTISSNNITIHVCVPKSGDLRDRWNQMAQRQDITEEFWMNTTYRGRYSTRDDEVTRCTVKTTRGFFELPNHHNGGKQGTVLLDRIPRSGDTEFALDAPYDSNATTASQGMNKCPSPSRIVWE